MVQHQMKELKQDITDASSQWEDIKALKVRKYKLKCDVALDGENAKSQIGVVCTRIRSIRKHEWFSFRKKMTQQKNTRC